MTNVSESLCKIAGNDYRRALSVSDIEAPKFEVAEWLTDWEWYVDSRLRDLWAELSVESKWVACIGAIEVWRRQNEAAP